MSRLARNATFRILLRSIPGPEPLSTRFFGQLGFTGRFCRKFSVPGPPRKWPAYSIDWTRGVTACRTDEWDRTVRVAPDLPRVSLMNTLARSCEGFTRSVPEALLSRRDWIRVGALAFAGSGPI